MDIGEPEPTVKGRRGPALGSHRGAARVRRVDGQVIEMATEVREREALAGVPTELFIGGHWRPASSGGAPAVEDPATEEPLLEVADAAGRGCPRGARRSRRGAGGVGQSPPRERGEILRRAYEEIIARTG